MLEIAAARALTERGTTAANKLWELVMLADQERACEALGHSNWDNYCAKELRDLKLRLPKGGFSGDAARPARSGTVLAGHRRGRRV